MDFGDVVAETRASRERLGDRRLTGGLNHAVFAVTLPDGTPACCKLFSPNDRQADRREWDALCLLRDAHPGLAPMPLYQEPGAVLMSFVEGDGVAGTSLSPRQVEALADCLGRLYRIPVPASALPVSGSVDGVDRVRRLHRIVTSDDPAVTVAGEWLATTEPDQLRQLDLSVFGRGDPNLANCLWNPPALTFVDWEHAGRTNRAFEIADLIEHIQSRATPDTTW